MPQLQKVYTLDITPEQFLNACSPEELQEVDLLLSKPSYQHHMNSSNQLKKNDFHCMESGFGGSKCAIQCSGCKDSEKERNQLKS